MSTPTLPTGAAAAPGAAAARVPLARRVTRRLAHTVAGFGVGLVVVVVGALAVMPQVAADAMTRLTRGTSGLGDPAVPTPTPFSSRREERIHRLVLRGHCWQEAAPAGAPPPTRAVVVGADGVPRLVRAHLGYEIWQHRVPGALYAFCP